MAWAIIAGSILWVPGCRLDEHFRAIDRDTGFFVSPSIDEWFPRKHLARFVVEVIDGLDLSGMARSYRGCVSASYDPPSRIREAAGPAGLQLTPPTGSPCQLS